MARKEPIPDSVLKTKVSQQLANRGLRTPCRINVDVRKGVLTMTGHVHYPHQRDAAMAAVRSVDGLMRIIEQIQVRPPAKHQYKTLPPLPKKTEGEAEAVAAEQGEAAAADTPPAEGATAKSGQTAPAIVAPAATAGGEGNVEVESSETDFDLGPAKVSPRERTPAETAPAAQAASGAGGSLVDLAGEDSSETDFDLGPAPVKRR